MVRRNFVYVLPHLLYSQPRIRYKATLISILNRQTCGIIPVEGISGI